MLAKKKGVFLVLIFVTVAGLGDWEMLSVLTEDDDDDDDGRVIVIVEASFCMSAAARIGGDCEVLGGCGII